MNHRRDWIGFIPGGRNFKNWQNCFPLWCKIRSVVKSIYVNNHDLLLGMNEEKIIKHFLEDFLYTELYIMQLFYENNCSSSREINNNHYTIFIDKISYKKLQRWKQDKIITKKKPWTPISEKLAYPNYWITGYIWEEVLA